MYIYTEKVIKSILRIYSDNNEFCASWNVSSPKLRPQHEHEDAIKPYRIRKTPKEEKTSTSLLLDTTENPKDVSLSLSLLCCVVFPRFVPLVSIAFLLSSGITK